LDAERERNHKLVGDNQRLGKELEQSKLELKLERQNKFATNNQKSADDEQDPQTAAALPEEKKARKKGAPVGHPAGFVRGQPSLIGKSML